MADALKVEIDGTQLPHRLYLFALARCSWRHATVIGSGESFMGLSTGLQAELWALGGVFEGHRQPVSGRQQPSRARRADPAMGHLRNQFHSLLPIAMVVVAGRPRCLMQTKQSRCRFHTRQERGRYLFVTERNK